MEMIPGDKPHHVTHQKKGNFISFLEYLVRFEPGGNSKKLFLIVESHYYGVSVLKKRTVLCLMLVVRLQNI